MQRLDRATLQKLREQHPAWRLLAASNAPFIISFLSHAFLASNVRTVPLQSLAPNLDDHLHEARDLGDIEMPKSAEAYLDDWANDSGGWLRKFYPPGTDEAHFDLTPAAERAIVWVTRLTEHRFVGTESRLLAVFRLLTEMIAGTEADPVVRLRDLKKQRDEIDAEIQRVRDGHLDVMDDSALRERFQLMASTARELLSDFRELEQSFHLLDRAVRQRITAWEGSRGELLDGILGERDAISSSDQGTSFRAFWDFLMAPERQEEFTQKLERVFDLPVVRATSPDPRLRRIHYDWLAAGEVTQRTVAKLSEQLRRYLDDQAFLENRRIVGLIRRIEQQALLMRDTRPLGTVAEIDDTAPAIELPLERPLFAPAFVAHLQNQVLEAGGDDVSADELFTQIAVDRARLRSNVRNLLQHHARVTLLDVVTAHPLQHGLAELVGYFAVTSEDRRIVVDETTPQRIPWSDRFGGSRVATVPLVIFCR
jgi:hypothetical protein